MLRVGLTGGIGSGKSTVAQRFRGLGAIVIDADQLAREVVAVDTVGLAAIRRRFGDLVLAPDGSLDRGVLGGIVFADAQARMDLEAITHPLIGARTRALMEAARPGKIVVHEVPLLAELDMAAAYHLTVAVCARDEVRMTRLTSGRGMMPAEARARIAAQASDQRRRAAADALLDNNGSVDELLNRVDELWNERIVRFNDNLVSGSASAPADPPALVASDESWPLTAKRLMARIGLTLGHRTVAVEHIGSTSVPGLVAQDVIDLQVGVLALADADDEGLERALADKGFPRIDEAGADGHLHGGADPGRIVRLYVREIDGPAWYTAILLRDWLRVDDDEREAYGALKRRWSQPATTTAEYVAAKGQWLEEAIVRADAWAGQLLRKKEGPPGWSSR